MEEILEIVGMDLADDSLMDTPKRVAKMYVNEIFWGLSPDAFPKCTAVANKIDYDEMVVERNIQVSSFCEHHLVAIDGKAHVGYIPNQKVLGLSKLNRIVEYFSKRPQIQEQLTEQITDEHTESISNLSEDNIEERDEKNETETISSQINDIDEVMAAKNKSIKKNIANISPPGIEPKATGNV